MDYHKAADKAYPRYHASIERILKAIGPEIVRNAEEMFQPLGSPSLTPVYFEALKDLRDTTADMYQQVFRDVQTEMVKHLFDSLQFVDIAEFEMRFDLLNPESLRAIDEEVGLLITRISAEQLQAIRAVMRRSYMESRDTNQTARDIEQIIGLTEVQAIANVNFYFSLLRDNTPAIRAQKLTQDYYKRQLRERATTIARTETIRANNVGQQRLWEQAIKNGYLKSSEARRKWIITNDVRACPYCRAAAAMLVFLQDEWSVTVGKRTLSVKTPPMHPNCRCAMALSFEPITQ